MLAIPEDLRRCPTCLNPITYDQGCSPEAIVPKCEKCQGVFQVGGGPAWHVIARDDEGRITGWRKPDREIAGQPYCYTESEEPATTDMRVWYVSHTPNPALVHYVETQSVGTMILEAIRAFHFQNAKTKSPPFFGGIEQYQDGNWNEIGPNLKPSSTDTLSVLLEAHGRKLSEQAEIIAAQSEKIGAIDCNFENIQVMINETEITQMKNYFWMALALAIAGEEEWNVADCIESATGTYHEAVSELPDDSKRSQLQEAWGDFTRELRECYAEG